LAARYLHARERPAVRGGEAEALAVHVVAVGDLEGDFYVARIERARRDAERLVRVEQLLLAEELRECRSRCRARAPLQARALSCGRLVQQAAHIVRDRLWRCLGRLDEEANAARRIEHINLG